MSSFRPTTFATASTCTGWTANSTPAARPACHPAQRRASTATATLAPACHSMLTAWNQTGPSNSQSSAKLATVSGRYSVPVRFPAQYGSANARHHAPGSRTNGLSTTMYTSSKANVFHRAPV